MTGPPNSPRSANGPSCTSSRSPRWREPSSGPWQVKQFSDRIGRTSRAKSTTRSAAGGASAAAARAPSQWAPPSIQRRTASICASDSGRPEAAGGIRATGSPLVSRWNSGLASASPGTTAVPMKSSVSSRRSACRATSFGPWQARHDSARIGRMSRLNSRGWAGPCAGAARTAPDRYAPDATASTTNGARARRSVYLMARPSTVHGRRAAPTTSRHFLIVV